MSLQWSTVRVGDEVMAQSTVGRSVIRGEVESIVRHPVRGMVVWIEGDDWMVDHWNLLMIRPGESMVSRHVLAARGGCRKRRELSARRRAGILEEMRTEGGPMQLKRIAQLMKLTPQAAIHHLCWLVDQGKVKRSGPKYVATVEASDESASAGSACSPRRATFTEEVSAA